MLAASLGHGWAVRSGRPPRRWALGVGALAALTVYVGLVIAALAVMTQVDF